MRAAVAVLGLALLCACEPQSGRAPAAPPHAAPAREGFTFASPERALSFPEDYGRHPEFQTEWWYYAGNLEGAAGRHFGYQLTLFRRSLQPPAETPAETPAATSQRAATLAATEIYMAHFAVTDTQSGRQHAFERFSRGAAPLAGVRADPHAIWIDDWRVDTTGDGERHLTASSDGVAIELWMRATKGPIPHGAGGYSRKGKDPRRASHYYSFPRLESRGTVRVGDATTPVQGWSWMDHEFTSSGLADHQIGWDWFSIQLDDGTDLMLFHLRTAGGGVDAFSSGSVIAADGSVTDLAREDFVIEISGRWTSPTSGADYPATWRLRVPSREIDLQVRPRIADQEITLSFVYWEGAVAVDGSVAGRPVGGAGYVELTGYALSMQGAF